MDRREAPPTQEGWYALHDMRRIDWQAWADAPQRARDRAIEDGEEFLSEAVAVDDAEAGATVVYSIVGHKADLLVLHLRPTMADIDALERRFEQTELGSFTEQTTSFVSVTEASGYSEKGRQFIEGELDDDSGLANYMRSRLYPQIPDAEHVCFYPMDKRRDPEYNWYDLPFDERADHMDVHGEIGREYAGKVTQMITGAIGFDDWEWGVTLWSNDMTQVKQLLYEMRFDPSSSKYADFGPFYVGNHMAPTDLAAFLAGEHLGEQSSEDAVAQDRPATPADAAESHGHAAGEGHGEDDGHHAHADSDGGQDEDDDGDHPSSGGGRPPTTDSWSDAIAAVEDLSERLDAAGLEAGSEFDSGYGLLFETDRDASGLSEEVEGLASNFDHYDTHNGTYVRASDGQTVLVSLWANSDAAQTASGFLTDLDGIEGGARGHYDAADVSSASGHDGSHDEGHAHDEGHSESADGAHAHDDGDHPESGGGRPPTTDSWSEAITDVEDLPARLSKAGVREGEHYDAGDYGLLFETEREAPSLSAEVEGLVENFEHYDSHVTTVVRANHGQTVLASIWTNEDAAQTASGFLTDLDGIGPGARGPLGEATDGDEAGASEGRPAGTDADADIRAELAERDIYAGQPHGEDVYALVLYSTADADALFEEVDDLRESFEHYDSHVKTAVYESDKEDAPAAVVSLWESADAAEKASSFLGDLPDIVRRAGEGEGFGTMGMFYTVKPDYREEFVDTFGTVGEKLATMEGHRETALMTNVEQETDMFIVSRWDEKENAMAFFRSEDFRNTVQWGREVLDDKPRHVFLA